MTNHLIQAYRQTPWRGQLQWIGLFLLALVLIASVSSVYLNVTTAAAATGREIQELENVKSEQEFTIANLKTQLAFLNSAAQMEKRAEDLKFKTPDPLKRVFIIVPNYTGREEASLASAPNEIILKSQPVIRASYTQSLLEWLFEGFSTSNPFGLNQGRQ